MKIYRIEEGKTVRERQRALPKGTIVEAWPDVFEPTVVWVTAATKTVLEAAAGTPLVVSAAVDGERISIFYPNEPRDLFSLPAEESLRARVVAGHGIGVTWYGMTSQFQGRPLPAPTSAEDSFFYLMRIGGATNHAWRLFRTRDDAIDFMGRNFSESPAAKEWALALPATRFGELLSSAAG